VKPLMSCSRSLRGERNAAFRMVLGYWDMAASFVTTGAIDPEAFLAAHSEIFATFSKIQPFLTDMRAAVCEPDFCRHLESVVMRAPDADAIMSRRRNALHAAAKARQSIDDRTTRSRPLPESSSPSEM
jgi:hypothetical protein